MYVQVVLCVYERPEGKIACKMELSRGGFSFSLSKTDCIQFCCCGFEKPTEKLKPNYPCELNHSYFIFFEDIKWKALFFWHFKKCFVWPTSDYLVIVFCLQNCSEILWEKIVLVIVKNFWDSRVTAENLQTHWDH